MSTTSIGNFSPDYYESLLTEGRDIRPLHCDTEKDLATVFEKVIIGLKNEGDWQVRISSLELLHSVAKGGGPQLDTFMQHLRQCHELVKKNHIFYNNIIQI